MLRELAVLLCVLALAGCRRQDVREKVADAAPGTQGSGGVQEAAAALPAKPDSGLGPKLTQELSGDFRGDGAPSRVLFFDDHSVVLAWSEGGTERRETISAAVPPGHRECKALHASKGQAFLLCMTWFTGPGGGRVDGVIFDLREKTVGEFFSSAINIDLLGSVCFTESSMGPMPSFNMTSWSIEEASAERDPRILITVHRQGWPSAQVAAIRRQPEFKKYCKCMAQGVDDCDEPKVPGKDELIELELSKEGLRPTAASSRILRDIAGQWGHSSMLHAWNLTVRGYGK